MSSAGRRRFDGCDEFVLADPETMEPLERFDRAEEAIFALAQHPRREVLEVLGLVGEVAVLTIVWGSAH